MSSTLKRQTFVTSRQMDFFSEKELVTQTGHPRDEWPLVFLKETIDNSLDACDEKGVQPEIHIAVNGDSISVRDNAGGIPDATIEGVVDFSVRASSREMYVAPDRGAQGNALMTLLGMPKVLSPEHGTLVIAANGTSHTFQCKADPVTQEPVIKHDTEASDIHDGTVVRIDWTGDSWPFGDDDDYDIADDIERLIVGFHLFNPHAKLTGHIFGGEFNFQPSCAEWKKWKPSDPTCPHWYWIDHLKRLIAAYIAQERRTGTSRTVAEFVREFKGLTGTAKAKAVLNDCELLRVPLASLATDDGLDDEKIHRLLTAMKRHSKIVKPSGLGIIGQDHFRNVLLRLGCVAESITYQKKLNDENGIPYVLESAFGWLGDEASDSRKIYAGANWSAAIKQPFRSFGATGEGLESLLSKQFASSTEPIVFAMHLAYPRIEYTDRGKSAIALSQQ
ncbi:MAG: hypothetical protein ABGZ35_21715 [Planctomycetaceae bacterium]